MGGHRVGQRTGRSRIKIDATIEDAVNRAPCHHGRRDLAVLSGEECGEAIPEARRKAIPGVRLCVNCQAERDADSQNKSGDEPARQQGQSAQIEGEYPWLGALKGLIGFRVGLRNRREILNRGLDGWFIWRD